MVSYQTDDYILKVLTETYHTYTFYITRIKAKIEEMEKTIYRDPTNWKIVAQLEALGIEVPPFKSREEEEAFQHKKKRFEQLKNDLNTLECEQFKIVQKIVRRQRFLGNHPHP